MFQNWIIPCQQTNTEQYKIQPDSAIKLIITYEAQIIALSGNEECFP
jgi:hypothetical protein